MSQRVTFDTNVFGPIAAPEAYPKCPDLESCRNLRELLATGKVQGFVSQASLCLEALGHEQRIDEFFRRWAMNSSKVDLPQASDQREAVVRTLFELGLKVLRVHNIALPSFVPVSTENWAADTLYSQEERLSRHSRFVRSFPDKGVAPLRNLGVELANLHDIPSVNWLQGLVSEFDEPRRFFDRAAFRRFVNALISEWNDVDLLGSHYAYGNEYFCTFDRANRAGVNAILGVKSRQDLQRDFGAVVVSPRKAVELICAQHG